jgi:hypothetical protein
VNNNDDDDDDDNNNNNNTVVTSGIEATFCNSVLRIVELFAGSKMSNFELIILICCVFNAFKLPYSHHFYHPIFFKLLYSNVSIQLSL